MIKLNKFNYVIKCIEAFVLSVTREGMNFASVERFLAKNNTSVC